MSIQLIEKRPISIPGDPNSHKTTPPRRLLKKLARVMPISKTWGVFPIRLACRLSAGGIAQTGVVGRYVGRGLRGPLCWNTPRDVGSWKSRAWGVNAMLAVSPRVAGKFSRRVV